MKKRQTYSDRQWLNKDDSPSTGSFVAYSGPSPWKKKERLTFIEIADCHEKVRLHIAPMDTKDDFIAKLIKLRNGLTKFIEYLQADKEAQ